MLNKNTSLLSLKKTYIKAFTIVELLVVIVVIGILAAITIVSYSGITNRAKIASIQSDLSNSYMQLSMFYVDNGAYPTTISVDCGSSPTTTTNLCIKPSSGTSYTAIPYSNPTPQSFTLTAVNGNISWNITDKKPPTAITDPTNWVTIGSQTWARANVNTGTMINGSTNQTNNAVVEKYCYNNLESNCTNHGGLYKWDEAMQYATAEGSRGICPVGSHIPSDIDLQILEVQLGTPKAQAEAFGWRGVDLGVKLKNGGLSGLNMPLSGGRETDGSFFNISSNAYIWSSSVFGVMGINRYLAAARADVERNANSKEYGFSVRCLLD